MLDANPPAWATVSELEGLLGLARQNIYKHIRRAGLEPNDRKQYDVHDVAAAILRHRERDNRLKATHTPELKARKLALEADILETKLRQLEATLVPVDAVRAQNRKIAQTIRQRLELLPERVAAILAAQLQATDHAHKVEATLRAEIRDALEALADELAQPIAPEPEAEADGDNKDDVPQTTE
jgi:hypothetical protein